MVTSRRCRQHGLADLVRVLALLCGATLCVRAQVAEPIILREYPDISGFWSVAPFSPDDAPDPLHDMVAACQGGGVCLARLDEFAGTFPLLFRLPIEQGDVTAAARIGDLDGDGKRDWLVRTASREQFGSCAGSLRVVTQADQLIQLSTELEPLQLREHDRVGCHGPVAALGDLDGDGVDDYGASDAECARAWSGASGEVLWGSPGGCDGDPLSRHWISSIVALPDLDDDGVGEIALARGSFDRPDSHAAGDPALVEVISGRTGTRVRALGGRRASGWGRAELSVIDDLDGDGVRDLALALAHERVLLCVSPVSGVTLAEIAAPVEAAKFGASVLATSDYDGDGVGELWVGAPNGGGASRDEPAHLYLVSPRRAEIVFTLRGRREADFLALFANLGEQLGHWRDIDGDGRPEPCVSESQYQGLGDAMQRDSMLLLSSSAIANDPRLKKLPD